MRNNLPFVSEPVVLHSLISLLLLLIGMLLMMWVLSVSPLAPAVVSNAFADNCSLASAIAAWVSALVAGVALAMAGGTLYYSKKLYDETVLAFKNQDRLNTLAASTAAHAQLAALYGQTGRALEFWNITAEDLKSADLKPEEVAILFGDIEAGAIWYEYHEPDSDKPFEPGSTRYLLCSSRRFQTAWPVIRKAFPATPYIKRYDITIRNLIPNPGAEHRA